MRSLNSANGFIKTMDKTEKRKSELCYNCKSFDVRETSRGIKFACKHWDNSLVGAMWCKFYQPTKKTEK